MGGCGGLGQGRAPMRTFSLGKAGTQIPSWAAAHRRELGQIRQPRLHLSSVAGRDRRDGPGSDLQRAGSGPIAFRRSAWHARSKLCQALRLPPPIRAGPGRTDGYAPPRRHRPDAHRGESGAKDLAPPATGAPGPRTRRRRRWAGTGTGSDGFACHGPAQGWVLVLSAATRARQRRAWQSGNG